MPEKHEVKIKVWKQDGKWIVCISGVTSGMEVHASDCDNMQVVFGLDASRFTPVISRE